MVTGEFQRLRLFAIGVDGHGTGFIDLPLYWKARTLTIHANGREPETLEFPCDHELVYEVRHVQACLSENRLTSPVVTEELSVAAMEAIEEIYRNWR